MLPPGFSLLLIVLHITESCNLKNQEEISRLAVDAGDAVLLPCECSSLQVSPGNLIWRKYDCRNGWRQVPTNQARFQLSNGQDPGNLSLLISGLEVKDEGLYRCETEKLYTDLHLRVTGAAITQVSRDMFYSIIPAVLLVLGLGGVVLWRYKAKNRKQTANSEGPTRQENEHGGAPRSSEQEPGRREQELQRNEQEPGRREQELQRNEQEPGRREQELQRNDQESQDDVMTYTTVIHTKTQQPKTFSADDGTEYASIRFN